MKTFVTRSKTSHKTQQSKPEYNDFTVTVTLIHSDEYPDKWCIKPHGIGAGWLPQVFKTYFPDDAEHNDVFIIDACITKNNKGYDTLFVNKAAYITHLVDMRKHRSY